MEKSKKRLAVCVDLAGLALFQLLCYSRFLDLTSTFFVRGLSDLRRLTHPLYEFTGQSLAQGVLPLWNPYWFAGYPNLALPEAASFYPTTFLYGLWDFSLVAKADFLIHIGLGGILAYFLARDIFANRWVAVVLGALFIAGPFATDPLNSGHLWWTHSASWMPLSFLCLRRIVTTGGEAWSPALAAVLALQIVGGGLQFVAYMVLIYGLYTGLELSRRRWLCGEPWRLVLRKGSLALTSVVLGVGMAAVQLLPSYELFQQSVRGGGVASSYFLVYRYPYTLFLGELLLRHELLVFIPGALTLALALLALFNRHCGERHVVLAVLLVCVVYARMPEWFYEWIRHLPVYGGFRGNIRVKMVLYPLFYLLACYGLKDLLDAPDVRHRRWRWVGVFFLTLGLTAVPVAAEPHLRLMLIPVLVAVGSLAAYIWFRGKVPVGAALLVTALLVGESLHFHHEVAGGERKVEIELPEDYLTFSRHKSRPDRTAIFERPRAARTIVENIGSVTGDRTLGGYHALLLNHYAELFQASAPIDLVKRTPEGRNEHVRPPSLGTNWIRRRNLFVLDLLNVRYLVTQDVHLHLPERLQEREQRFAASQVGGLRVYENLGALPVAWTVHRAEVVGNDEAARERLRSPDFDYRKTVVLTRDHGLGPLAPATGPEPVRDLKLGGNEVELEVTLTAPGILVLSEVTYPGWTVRVNGGPKRPVLTVDTVLRGVALETGRHRVHFVFRPTSLLVGAVVSSLSLLVCLVWAGVCMGRLRNP